MVNNSALVGNFVPCAPLPYSCASSSRGWHKIPPCWFLRADGGWTTNDNRNLDSHTKHEDLGQEHGKPSADETVARRSFSGCLRFRAVRRAHVVAAKTKGVDIGVSFVTKSLCHRRHATATTTVLPSSSASGDEGQRRPPCHVSSGSAKFQW